MKKTSGFIVSLCISGVAIAWLVSRIDLSEVQHTVTQVHYPWVIAATVLYLAGFLPRGLRWQLMLSTIQRVSLAESTRVVIMGYAANNVLPFRLGEVVRAYIMGSKNNISRITCLGSIATERIIDGIIILFLLGLSMVFLTPSIQQAAGLNRILLTGGIVFLSAVAVLVLVLAYSEKIPLLWEKYIGETGYTLIQKSIRSVIFLRSKHLLVRTMTLSVIVWLLEGLMFVLILWAMGLDNPIASGYFCLGIINLGILIPSAPGYVGVFQAAAVFSFLTLGLSEASGLAFGLLIHVLQFIPVTLIGIVFFLRYGYRFNEFYKAVSGAS